jgi:Peptidase A4 family
MAATPAGAAVHKGGSFGTRARRASLTLAIPVEKSTQTAGYLTEKSGIKTVSTTFEVPKITNCTASSETGMGPVVILLGTKYFVGAGAEAECMHGTLTYQIAVNHNGSETHYLTVSPEDEISVEITIGAKVSVKIEDLTTKQSTSQLVPKGKVSDAELGDDSLTSGGKEVPIPKFTHHKFSDVMINGKVLVDAKPLVAEELVRAKTVLIKAGALDKAGNSFVMSYKHAR